VSAKGETFASLVLLLVSTGIFFVAFAIRITLLPDIVAIADAEASQSVWRLEAAVLLRAVENIAGFGAFLVLMALAAQRIKHWVQSPISGD
jgi:hypothetical protein